MSNTDKTSITKNHYKLVISDLDGTLLGANHQLSQETLDTLRALHRSHIPFWIATGRHHQDALLIQQQIGFPLRMITANGATVSNVSGDLEVAYSLPLEAAQGILSLPTPDGVYTNAYQGHEWLTAVPDKVFEDYYHPGGFTFTVCHFQDRWQQPLNKIFFTAMEPELLIPIAESVRQDFGDFVDVTFSMPKCLEIMPKGINKGSAIAALLAAEGISPESVLAYGDGMNDLEMLSFVGQGHLMANAHPMLKAALPHLPVIGHHDEHAVAKSIQAYFKV